MWLTSLPKELGFFYRVVFIYLKIEKFQVEKLLRLIIFNGVKKRVLSQM